MEGADSIFSFEEVYVSTALWAASGSSGRGEWWAEGGRPLAFFPVLSHFLQLLSQPGRQRLPQSVQQLGEFHVVVSVVA